MQQIDQFVFLAPYSPHYRNVSRIIKFYIILLNISIPRPYVFHKSSRISLLILYTPDKYSKPNVARISTEPVGFAIYLLLSSKAAYFTLSL